MEGGVTSTWLRRHRPMYDRATRHPFVLAIRDGTVDLSSFKRWLGQDYIFVRGFVPFVASVLLKACKQSTDDDSHMEEILSGVASLNEEISWFKKEASKWDIDLSNVTPKKANIDYTRLLQGLTLPEVDFSVAITAFWAIEVVYQESFSVCLETGSKTPAELLGTCQRWGSANFGLYCRSLQKIADSYLEKSSEDVLKMAEEAFCSVLEQEIDFWNMSSDEH